MLRPFLGVTLALLTGCFVLRRVRVDEVRAPVADSVQVSSPVKVHLLDGTTVLYGNGVTVRADRLVGPGQRYGLRLQFMEVVHSVPIDSVVGLESYRSVTDPIATVGLSFVATTVGAAAITATAAAIFGSCPTFYSDSAGTPILEAEGFSYSIAPLFEARDVDRLRAQPDRHGVLRLEVRNEALETHDINHLELLEARHAAGEWVVPESDGRLLALASLLPPAMARDRSGHDLTDRLRRADGSVFASDTLRLARVTEPDFTDYIDLVFPPVPRSDSLALAFRLRNSLLNTVLLYDEMLGSRAGRALDWQNLDLAKVGPALALGTWYSGRMGLRVLVRADSGYREVGRVRDTGPIAWKDVAVVLPWGSADSVRVRLTFPTDNWRIDRVALAPGVRRPVTRVLPPASVEGGDRLSDPAALNAIRHRDRRYLETRPGQHLTALWDTGPGAATGERTFFLASQGYYTEWIRGSWLATARDTSAFVASDASLVRAMRRWHQMRDSLEARFYASRIPVR